MAEDTPKPAAQASASTSITMTPEELSKLVSEKVEAQFRDMMKGINLAATMQPVASEADPQTAAILSKLAMEIGIISDQGTQRKRVAPEELKERANAFERMGVLLTKAQLATTLEDKPRYMVAGQLYFGDQRIDAYQRQPNRDIIQTEIYFDGIPNTSMRPLNKLAEDIYREFIRYLGGSEAVNGVPKPVQPVWLTNGGKVIVGTNETAQAHGLARNPEPLTIDGGKRVGAPAASVHVVSPTDPRATRVPVLGTIAPPAVVGGTTPKVL